MLLTYQDVLLTYQDVLLIYTNRNYSKIFKWRYILEKTVVFMYNRFIICETDTLEYLDFDTHNEIDIAFYPDSGKVGIWCKNINKLFRLNQKVEYYDGE